MFQLVMVVYTWGFAKIRGTLLVGPILRTIVFGVLYWGPPILGNYHIALPLAKHAGTLASSSDSDKGA